MNQKISRKYKEGYIKYQSEQDLNSFFSDSEKNLYNFNKVFFFTGLSYLEEGPSKLQNLSDYKKTTIKLVNYDARYYRITVDNNQVNVFGNSFESYEGDEIKITDRRGKMPQKVEIAKEGLTIALKKIIPPKPTKPRNKKKKMLPIIIAICSLLVLVILGFFFMDDIVNVFKGPDKTKHKIKNLACHIRLDDGNFTDGDEKPKTDPEELLECFKEDKGWIQIGNEKYRLIDSVHTIQQYKDKNWIVVKNNNELENLKKRLLIDDKDSVSKEVIYEIDKIINLNKLTKKGLEGKTYLWQWKNNKLLTFTES